MVGCPRCVGVVCGVVRLCWCVCCVLCLLVCVLKMCVECAFCCGVLCCVVACGVWCVGAHWHAENPIVCGFKSLRVYVQDVSVCGTHAGVLPVHTETS